jgi:hypothetical protein
VDAYLDQSLSIGIVGAVLLLDNVIVVVVEQVVVVVAAVVDRGGGCGHSCVGRRALE